jgi:hypothetical protein
MHEFRQEKHAFAAKPASPGKRMIRPRILAREIGQNRGGAGQIISRPNEFVHNPHTEREKSTRNGRQTFGIDLDAIRV